MYYIMAVYASKCVNVCWRRADFNLICWIFTIKAFIADCVCVLHLHAWYGLLVVKCSSRWRHLFFLCLCIYRKKTIYEFVFSLQHYRIPIPLKFQLYSELHRIYQKKTLRKNETRNVKVRATVNICIIVYLGIFLQI